MAQAPDAAALVVRPGVGSRRSREAADRQAACRVAAPAAPNPAPVAPEVASFLAPRSPVAVAAAADSRWTRTANRSCSAGDSRRHPPQDRTSAGNPRSTHSAWWTPPPPAATSAARRRVDAIRLAPADRAPRRTDRRREWTVNHYPGCRNRCQGRLSRLGRRCPRSGSDSVSGARPALMPRAPPNAGQCGTAPRVPPDCRSVDETATRRLCLVGTRQAAPRPMGEIDRREGVSPYTPPRHLVRSTSFACAREYRRRHRPGMARRHVA